MVFKSQRPVIIKAITIRVLIRFNIYLSDTLLHFGEQPNELAIQLFPNMKTKPLEMSLKPLTK